MYVTKLQVDLSGRITPAVVYAKQGDVGARQVEITLLDNGAPYAIPEGAAARIRVSKPDRTYVYNSCTIEENVITLPILLEAGDHEHFPAELARCRNQLDKLGELELPSFDNIL